MANKMPIHFSFFDNATDTVPAQDTAEGGLKAVYNLFSQEGHDIRTKKDGSAFSAVTYKENGRRCKADIVEMTAVVLDYDDTPVDPVLALIQKQGWEAMAYSTYSHTSSAPCFRVILSLSKPIPAGEAEAFMRAIDNVLGGQADPEAMKLAQMYYLPSCPKGSDPWMKYIKGAPIDTQQIKPMKAKKPWDRKGSQSDSSGDDKGLTPRDLAERIKDMYGNTMVYVMGYLREYREGHWAKIEKQVMLKTILSMDGKLSRRSADEVYETLKTLVAATPEREAGFMRPEPLVCVSNGTVDLNSGRLLEHDPDHCLMWQFPLEWSPSDRPAAPEWDRFLESIWGACPDFADRVSFIEEWLGYVLLPHCKFERFVWLYGPGGNGKSVLANVMSELAGRGGKEAVTTYNLDELAQMPVRESLARAVLNISYDLSSVSKAADGHLKSITSGEKMSVAAKYGHPYQITPRVKLVASTNRLPRLSDTTAGFTRRAVILDFPRVIAAELRDPNLFDKLKVEMDAILHRAILGALRLVQRGRFIVPSSSEGLVGEYVVSQDPVARFKNGRLKVDDAARLSTQVVYAEYREWCFANGYAPMNSGSFSHRLKELGVTIKKSHGLMMARVRLVDPAEAETETGSAKPPRRQVTDEEFLDAA